MRQQKRLDESRSPQERLSQFAREALRVAKIAKRHKKSLSGENHYADKMAELTANAANCVLQLAGHPPMELFVLAENINRIFAADTERLERLERCRDLQLRLRTIWKEQSPIPTSFPDHIFPQVLMVRTGRLYFQALCKQANGCFESGWFDACSVIMRRILETSIIEAFEAKKIAQKIKNKNGDFVYLADLISSAFNEQSWNLSRNTKHGLSQLKDLGDKSAHSRYFMAHRGDVEKLQPFFRVAVEEFLHLANLLK